MNLTGENRLAAPREVVWRALNDPEILRRSIPGCESVEKLSDTELTAKVTLAIGPMKAKFTGKVTLSDLDPPAPGKETAGYTISGEGQGGVAGFGKGRATVKLDAAPADQGGPDVTILRYAAEAQVGGKIAQLGARLIDATARKLADEFFSRFAAIINAPPAAPSGEAPTGPQPQPVPAEIDVAATRPLPGSSDTAAPPFVPPPAFSGSPEDTTGLPPGAAAGAGGGGDATSAGRLRPAIWVPLLIAIVAVVLWWFARP